MLRPMNGRSWRMTTNRKPHQTSQRRSSDTPPQRFSPADPEAFAPLVTFDRDREEPVFKMVTRRFLRLCCLLGCVLGGSSEPRLLARLRISVPGSSAPAEALQLFAGDGIAEAVAAFCKERLPCSDVDRRAMQDELWKQIYAAEGADVNSTVTPRKAPELLRIPVEVRKSDDAASGRRGWKGAKR
eukprot:scaffold1954_cov268-Pinguiococcus_pyrenoidosus.AAC.172